LLRHAGSIYRNVRYRFTLPIAVPRPLLRRSAR
jgi:hypothetical protein